MWIGARAHIVIAPNSDACNGIDQQGENLAACVNILKINFGKQSIQSNVNLVLWSGRRILKVHIFPKYAAN